MLSGLIWRLDADQFALIIGFPGIAKGIYQPIEEPILYA